MSELRVDDINNSAGTGAPDFPNGLSLSGGSTVSALEYGTYTPTWNTSSGSISGYTTYDLHYLRVGDVFMIGGRVDITFTGNTGFVAQFTLPSFVTTNYTAVDEAGGSGNAGGNAVHTNVRAASGTVKLEFNGFSTAGASTGVIHFNAIAKIL